MFLIGLNIQAIKKTVNISIYCSTGGKNLEMRNKQHVINMLWLFKGGSVLSVFIPCCFRSWMSAQYVYLKNFSFVILLNLNEKRFDITHINKWHKRKNLRTHLHKQSVKLSIKAKIRRNATMLIQFWSITNNIFWFNR